MRIHSLSRIIGIPVGLAAAYLLYTIFFTYDDVQLWVIISLACAGVALIVFNGQIDHWYLERHPLELDATVQQWLLQYDVYYQQLDDAGRAEMGKRTALYERGRAFEAVGQNKMNDVPFDVRSIISAQAVKMTMHQDDYLMGDMDRVFLYKHPFPSPRHQQLHTVETELEDGVIIFALDHLLLGLQEPDKYYNICGHGMAEAYIKVYTTEKWPDSEELRWSELELISGFTKDQILAVLGYPSIDLLPPYIMYYFTAPDRLQKYSPAVYLQLQDVFRTQQEAA